MAGLVGGDSDSSALTQESGDEGDAASSSAATEAVDEEAEDKEEDVEMRESPPGKSHPSFDSSHMFFKHLFKK
jgi:MRG-binding protein